jgi:hypothetical protein
VKWKESRLIKGRIKRKRGMIIKKKMITNRENENKKKE